MTRLLVLLLLALSASSLRAQPLHVHADSLEAAVRNDVEQLYWFRAGWRVRPGLDINGAARDLDDTDWTPTDFRYPDAELDWRGEGWFRLHLDVDPSMVDRDLVIGMGQMGASEVFLDGRRVAGFGTVAGDLASEVPYVSRDWAVTFPVRFGAPGRHVIAVRYSNHHFERYPFLAQGLTDQSGFVMGLGDRRHIDGLLISMARAVNGRQALWGLPFVLALLHYLIWLGRRQAREHLEFGLFADAIAGMLFFPFQTSFATGVWTTFFFITAFKISLVCSAWFGIRVVHRIFTGAQPRYISLTGYLLAALVGAAWALPLEVYYVLTLVGFFDTVRVIVRNRHRSGAGIIGAGCGLLTLLCLVQVLINVDILPVNFVFPYVYGILALVVSMSVHLAREYARTHSDLEDQLERVQSLIVVTLAQEREALRRDAALRDRETERRLLETENEIRTRELEEARKRQEDLERLETANSKLRDTRARLVQTERMAAIGNLVAGIAHEINTPVGAIRSSHDTLVRAVDRLEETLARRDDTRGLVEDSRALRIIREANRVIHTGTERVTEIVRSLRNFARLDEAAKKRVDIHEGIESTLTLVHHHLKNRISVDKQFDDIPPVTCYPGRLNQVFLNLLVNAAQAIPGEGRITIATSTEGRDVLVRISDTGTGIDAEHLDRIFDSGYTTKKTGEGTGLGLSISRQIVHDHDGEITVDSTPGQGTTFTVRLPIG